MFLPFTYRYSKLIMIQLINGNKLIEVKNMEYIFIGLLGFSLLLFVLSFFLKDPYKILRAEIDENAIYQVQELYIIKKKLKLLEEELLVEDNSFQPATKVYTNTNLEVTTPPKAPKKEIHEIIKNQVWSLAQQDVSIDQIAKQASLSKADVDAILIEMMNRR